MYFIIIIIIIIMIIIIIIIIISVIIVILKLNLAHTVQNNLPVEKKHEEIFIFYFFIQFYILV